MKPKKAKKRLTLEEEMLNLIYEMEEIPNLNFDIEPHHFEEYAGAFADIARRWAKEKVLKAVGRKCGYSEDHQSGECCPCSDCEQTTGYNEAIDDIRKRIEEEFEDETN